MGFIQSLIDGYKRKKQEKNDACDALIKKIDIAFNDMNALFVDKQIFIEYLQPLRRVLRKFSQFKRCNAI